MQETIVVNPQTAPPLVTVTLTLADILGAYMAALITNPAHVKLFVNNIIVSAATQLPELVEASAPGYAPNDLEPLNGPYIDQSGNAYAATNRLDYFCLGGGTDICYGVYVVQETGAPATVTFTESGGEYTLPVITSGGAGYVVAPRVKATGATGTGAVLTATITGGVVTAITIVNPGSGYTTATATIEPPEKLIFCANFPVPKPLQSDNDDIGVVIELAQLAA